MQEKTTRALPFAIIAVLASYVLILTGHAVTAMYFGALGTLLGTTGLIRSASPRISGGVLSAITAVLGLLAAFLAGLEDIGVIGF
jgi:hypothetical protein